MIAGISPVGEADKGTIKTSLSNSQFLCDVVGMAVQPKVESTRETSASRSALLAIGLSA